MLISKVDVKDFTQFTLNIEDRIFNSNITDAQEYDLRPTIGDLMMNQLLLIAPNGFINWNALTIYAIGDYVLYGTTVYKSLTANVGLQPDTNITDWQVNELGTFFYNYLRVFLVFTSYGRFLLWIGTNLTQYGLREINEETSVGVSDQRRAELIADIKQKSNIWLTRLRGIICDKNFTFDGVNYNIDNCNYRLNPRKTFKIRPVGKLNLNYNLPNNQLPINQTENDFRNGN